MNAAGLLLLKQRENAPLLAHPDDPKNLRAFWDPIGRVWTIGYGHTGPYPYIATDDGLFSYGPSSLHTVTGGMVLEDRDALRSEENATLLLAADVAIRERRLLPKLPQGLNDNQQAALTLLAYNVGVGAVLNSHLLLAIRRALATWGPPIAPLAVHEGVPLRDLWLQWDHGEVGGKEQEIADLKARREAEWQLFTTPVAPAQKET